MPNKSIELKVADILIKKGILTFSFKPPYVYSTGLKSPIYIDNRMLISFPKERTYIVNKLLNLAYEKKIVKPNYISSTLSFAAPFGILVAEALNLPMILVREERRTHGKKNKIEGFLPKRSKVLVVEDHISTGAALIDNVEAIRKSGSEVTHAIAITDYGIDIAKKSLRNAKVKARVLAKGSSIFKEVISRKMLNKREKKEVLEWFEDPVKWGEERGYYDNSN